MTFIRNNWPKLVTVIFLVVLLVIVYVYIFARPDSEHYEGDNSMFVPPRTLVLT